jgi:transcription elongation GreA/GreB family factor
MNLASGIRLTHLDATRLNQFANELLRRAEVLGDAGHALMNLLYSARVVSSEAIPPDVVTMNSTLVFEDRATGKRKEASVVYPTDADPARGKLSVFSPVGNSNLRSIVN